MKKLLVICLSLIMMFQVVPVDYVSADATYEGELNYLSDEAYADLGIVTDSPEVFDTANTEEPLADYEEIKISELLIGDMNRTAAWAGAFRVMNETDALSAEALSIGNLEDNLAAEAYDFSQIYAENNTDYEVGSMNACAFDKDGDGTDEVFSAAIIQEKSTNYSKIEFRYHDLVDGKWTTSDAAYYYLTDDASTDRTLACNIDADTAKAYLSLTAGDFDQDGREEVAAYLPINRPRSGSGQIWVMSFSSSSTSMPGLEYRINIDDTFGTDFIRQGGIPIVHLATTSISGEDHLVINISEQFSDRNVEQASKMQICKFKQYNSDPIWLYKSGYLISDDGSRMRFASAVDADVNGNGVEELIVAGFKNKNYSDNTDPGTLSSDENLLQALYWDGTTYQTVWDDLITVPGYGGSALCLDKEHMEPAALAAGKLHINSDCDQLFLEGVVLSFTGGTLDGKSEGAQLKPGSFYTETSVPLGGSNDAFFSTASAGVFSTAGVGAEQFMILSGDHKAGNQDVIYYDILTVWEDGGKLTSSVTTNDYLNGKDTNDGGTFVFMLPVDVDEDAIKFEYVGKTYGWSDTQLYGIIQSAPYWKELQYNDQVNIGVGSSSLEITNGHGDGDGDAWGIGGGVFFDVTLMGGAKFLSNKAALGGGVEFSAVAQYMHDYAKVKTRSESYKFTTSAGNDYAVIYAVPVVNYEYNMWVPTFTVTQAYVDEYNNLNEENGVDEPCPYEVGDVIEGHMEPCNVVMTLDPAFSTLTIDDYNEVIEQLDGETKLVEITADMLTTKTIGDPSTYPSTAEELKTAGNVTELHVSKKGISVQPGSFETEISYEKTRDETTTESVDLSVHAGVFLAGEGTAGFLAVVEEEGKIGLEIDGGYTRNWISTDAEGINFSTVLKGLPAGADDYAFTGYLAAYQLDLPEDGSGSEIVEDPYTISYLVESVDGNKTPPAIPDNFSVFASTENEVVLKWDETRYRPAESYEIYTLDNTDQAQLIGTTDKNYFVATHLDPGTSYQYAIKSYSGEGATGVESVLSYWITAKTKDSAASMPYFTKQPPTMIVTPGDDSAKVLTAEASIGEGMDEDTKLTYQWQKYSSSSLYTSGTWDNISGATESTYTLPTITSDDGVFKGSDGNVYDEHTYYRVVATQTLGGNVKSVISKAASMIIQSDTSNYTYHQLDAKLSLVGDETIQSATEGTVFYAKDGESELVFNVQLTNKDEVMDAYVPDADDIYLMYESSSTGEYGVLDTATLEKPFDTISTAEFTVSEAELAEKAVTEIYAVYTGNVMDDYQYYLPAQSNTLDAVCVKSYQITYVLNDGINDARNPKIITNQTDLTSLYPAAKRGYTFEGWYLDKALSVSIEDIDPAALTEQLTLYAKYKLNQYAVHYVLNGGINAEGNPESYSIEDSWKIGNPSREGYIFAGWYTDEALTNPLSALSLNHVGDITLYAAWEADSSEGDNEDGLPPESGDGDIPSDENPPADENRPSDEEQPADEDKNDGEQSEPEDGVENLPGDENRPSEEDKVDDDTPETGDTNHLFAWTVLLFAAAYVAAKTAKRQ